MALVVVAVAFLAAGAGDRTAGRRTVPRDSGVARHPSWKAPPEPACDRARPAACGWHSKPGRGDEAVPLRSAFAGAVLGIAGITAVLVFAASLADLVATPRLSGWNWDFKTEVGTAAGKVCVDGQDYGFAGISGIGAIEAVCNPNIQVDDRP